MSHVPFDKRDVMMIVDIRLIRMQHKMTVFSREINTGHLMHQLFGAPPILDQIPDRDEFQVPLSRQIAQSRNTGHIAVIIHDFTEQAHRTKTGETSQVG